MSKKGRTCRRNAKRKAKRRTETMIERRSEELFDGRDECMFDTFELPQFHSACSEVSFSPPSSSAPSLVRQYVGSVALWSGRALGRLCRRIACSVVGSSPDASWDEIADKASMSIIAIMMLIGFIMVLFWAAPLAHGKPGEISKAIVESSNGTVLYSSGRLIDSSSAETCDSVGEYLSVLHFDGDSIAAPALESDFIFSEGYIGNSEDKRIRILIRHKRGHESHVDCKFGDLSDEIIITEEKETK